MSDVSAVLPFYLSYTELFGAQDPVCASLDYHPQVAFSEPTTYHTVLSMQDTVDSIFIVYY